MASQGNIVFVNSQVKRLCFEKFNEKNGSPKVGIGKYTHICYASKLFYQHIGFTVKERKNGLEFYHFPTRLNWIFFVFTMNL